MRHVNKTNSNKHLILSAQVLANTWLYDPLALDKVSAVNNLDHFTLLPLATNTVLNIDCTNSSNKSLLVSYAAPEGDG